MPEGERGRGEGKRGGEEERGRGEGKRASALHGVVLRRGDSEPDAKTPRRKEAKGDGHSSALFASRHLRFFALDFEF
jgi:hypothetical protein